MAAKETYVGVQPYTGSGLQKIRNLELTVLDPATATLNTVEMQVVSIADERGIIFNEFVEREWRDAMLTELRGIRKGIEQLVGNPFLTQGE